MTSSHELIKKKDRERKKEKKMAAEKLEFNFFDKEKNLINGCISYMHIYL